MRVLKFVVNAFILFVLLPVSIVAVLGIAFSPLQPTARAVEPRAAFEASDIMWDSPVEGKDEPAPEAGAEADAETEPQEASIEPIAAAEDELQNEVVVQPVSLEEGDAAGSSGHYGSDELRSQGVIYDGAYRYTWYSQRVLPGGGLDIDGRHVSDEGYVVDAQERIVVASSDLPRGTELEVPFGNGRAVVLDTGCASGTIDVYTDF